MKQRKTIKAEQSNHRNNEKEETKFTFEIFQHQRKQRHKSPELYKHSFMSSIIQPAFWNDCCVPGTDVCGCDGDQVINAKC